MGVWERVVTGTGSSPKRVFINNDVEPSGCATKFIENNSVFSHCLAFNVWRHGEVC
jgi:hypothetical protein